VFYTLFFLKKTAIKNNQAKIADVSLHLLQLLEDLQNSARFATCAQCRGMIHCDGHRSELLLWLFNHLTFKVGFKIRSKYNI